MAELKQIEVNGTTYDIAVAGSELPIVCETYSAGDSGDGAVGKLSNTANEDTTYTELPVTFCLKDVDDGDGNHTYSIVCAIPDSAIT